jgi:hypothetical protein
MRFSKHREYVVLIVAALSLAIAPAEERRDALTNCAEDLQLPRSGPGPTGKPGDKAGPITATVVPDSSGHPSSIAVSPAFESGAELVKSYMSGSKFSGKCAGQQLVLRFSFVTEGPPIEYPFSWVTFESPNHFIIHSRARIPTIFKAPGSKDDHVKR